jgi:prepilin-type N-terminal cleavage/methylation domain-containing protein
LKKALQRQGGHGLNKATIDTEIKEDFFVNRINRNGFTLIEVLIVIALSVVVGGILFSIYSSSMKSTRSQNIIVDMNQTIRSAVYIMKRELQMSGYDPENTSRGEASTGGIIAPTSGTSSSITFRYVADDDGLDNNSNSSTDESGELATVTFALYDQDTTDGITDNTTLGRTDDFGTIPIAENIEQLEFSLSTAAADNSTLVRITMLVMGNKTDRSIDAGASRTYTAPDSGTTWTIPAGDLFRRELVSFVVKCRNT